MGLFSIGGDYEGDEQKGYQQSEVKNLVLSFDILRVIVNRPWMDGTVFESGAWDWARNSTHYGKLIATGVNYAKGETPPSTDAMPFLPTGILIARNVQMSADWSFDIKSFTETRQRGGGSFGFGPFKLGGRSDKHDRDTYTLAQANGNTITYSNPQIIGYLSQVLQKSPNRDASLKWPDTGPVAGASEVSTDPRLARANELLKQLTSQ